MHRLFPSPHTISFAAARARLAAGQFDHLWSVSQRKIIETTVDEFPAVHAAIIGTSSALLIPCTHAEIDRLFADHITAGRIPPMSGFKTSTAFQRWHVDLRTFVTVVNAWPPHMLCPAQHCSARNVSGDIHSAVQHTLHFTSALRAA